MWRRLRGLLGTALVWAGTWTVVGLLVGAGFWLSGTTFFSLRGSGWLVLWAEVGAITGALSGAAFSLALMWLERRREFSTITPLRFGAFGAVTAGSVMAALSYPEWLVFGSIGALMGFVCGSGSVVVARRALSPPATPLPPSLHHSQELP